MRLPHVRAQANRKIIPIHYAGKHRRKPKTLRWPLTRVWAPSHCMVSLEYGRYRCVRHSLRHKSSRRENLRVFVNLKPRPDQEIFVIELVTVVSDKMFPSHRQDVKTCTSTHTEAPIYLINVLVMCLSKTWNENNVAIVASACVILSLETKKTICFVLVF